MQTKLSSISDAVHCLRQGKTVVLPTETVYGLAALALEERAVAQIFAIKQRPAFNPLIVHGADESMFRSLVRDFPSEARELARRFWPGPLTLVLPKTDRVPDLVTAGNPSVALRVPRHAVATAVLQALGEPLAAPSANPFGRLSPTRIDDLAPEIVTQVGAVLDGGPCEVGVESTIVSFLEGKPALLRAGAVTEEALEAVVGPLVRQTAATTTPTAPGQLLSHYAPRTPLRLASPEDELPRGRLGLLTLTTEGLDLSPYAEVESLSPSGDLTEAAQHLFSALRRLELAALDWIVAYPVPARGLGVAINDRLFRAAGGQSLSTRRNLC